jgi:hypothetical protein
VLIHVVHSNQGPSLLGFFPFSHLNRIKYTQPISIHALNNSNTTIYAPYKSTPPIYPTNIFTIYPRIFITKVFVFYVLEEERLHILTY